MRAMKVEKGIVVNIVVFDSEEEMFDGYIVAIEGVNIGATDNGDGTFTAPPSPVELE